ncbi:MAG: hypothetical protein MMC33_005528 [Icmadophila ericetorum]|nr:hypothetical protein [Icmadophila ericetorum]
MILRKDQLEASLHEEKKLIESGRLKEDNPLDVSEAFHRLCEACRRGDLKTCQEAITEGANLNARDEYDYTPLILASLCGHYEVVQLLLESGALCERDTFQGERCLYNALNDRIRNLLLEYEYSKSSDPLQPLASHITSLLSRDHPKTSDIVVTSAEKSFNLHKFVLSARSPYFRIKLSHAPDTISYKLPANLPPQAFEIAIRYLYLGEIPTDVGGGPGTGFSEEEIVEGIDRISKQLEVRSLWDGVLESGDRRMARQNRTEEVQRGRDQIHEWFKENVVKHKVVIERAKAEDVKWDRDNSIFADVLLQTDEEIESPEGSTGTTTPAASGTTSPNGVRVGPLALGQHSSSEKPSRQTSTLFPAHKAVLIRSEYFLTMFSSHFREALHTPHLQIVHVECSPEVLEIVLKYLYTEIADIPLELAVDVLMAADQLLIDKLKTKAAVVISTLGSGSMAQIQSQTTSTSANSVLTITAATRELQDDPLDIYDVLRVGWLTRVPRLETFAARYLAYRLEYYIDQKEFADIIKESAGRIVGRQETDSIEILDDIRHYLSERFRLRFEDTGFEEMEEEEMAAAAASANSDPSINGAPNGVGDKELNDATGALSLPSEYTSEDLQESPANPNTVVVRTLDGEETDEFSEEAVMYQMLLEKIDALLERLALGA